jgi:hypothetical protein
VVLSFEISLLNYLLGYVQPLDLSSFLAVSLAGFSFLSALAFISFSLSAIQASQLNGAQPILILLACIFLSYFHYNSFSGCHMDYVYYFQSAQHHVHSDGRQQQGGHPGKSLDAAPSQ